MSNYVKATNFASKDSLPVGDADKKVKGTEIDNELNAISDAIESKADSNSSTLTGTPVAPTASAGTNTTQIATTAFVTDAVSTATGSLGTLSTQDADAVTITGGSITGTSITGSALAAVYPIGSVYINATNSTNPNTLLGFGTWVAFGAGRVPVGFDSGDSDFNTAEKTGGAKTHTLTVDEMPAHTHNYEQFENGGPDTVLSSNVDISGNYRTQTTTSTGGGSAHNNLQPYITVYMWKRTA